ncbi:hypothetical protein [Actinomadura sp. 6N118]|uniref:hypothetical protein n=1 Tax=Actinomadura sp. 6N118 TaxID=3375151 RepID=UPI0037B39C8F
MTASPSLAGPRSRVLSDWASAHLLKPLPRTVRPIHDETVTSYLRRLAEANSMHGYYLTDYLRGTKNHKVPIPPELVITLSGQPAHSLRYAMLELCTAEELTTMKVAGRPRPRTSSTWAKCTRCTHARSVYEPVTCWQRSEDVICHWHRRWTPGTQQLDLTEHTDIIRVNRTHRRLIRRHGRTAVHRAFITASHIVSEWVERNSYRGYFDQIMERFHGPEWHVRIEDPTYLASKYVPTVALTRLIASPRWRALALDPVGNAIFVNEMRRTVDPNYVWDPVPSWRRVEPLARMFRDEQRDREREARHAELRRIHNLPEPRGETIESDELRHDY